MTKTDKKQEIVKKESEVGISEAESKVKDKRVMENYKSWRVSYIEFAESVYDAYSSKIWTALGFNNWDAYCSSRFSNDNLGRTTVREAIRVWSQMKEQLAPQFDEESKLVDETKKRLKRALEASGGKSSYVQELVRYDVAKDFDKALTEVKVSKDINDVKARLRKKFKPLNQGQVDGEAGKKGVAPTEDRGETVSMTFQFQVSPTDDLSIVNKALEVSSIELGTRVPASEMTSPQRGRLLASIVADYLGSSDIAAETMDDAARREMAKMKLRDGVRILLGVDPTQDLLLAIYGAINVSIEKYMADNDGGDDEEDSVTIAIDGLKDRVSDREDDEDDDASDEDYDPDLSVDYAEDED
jgi:hypothetical protein